MRLVAPNTNPSVDPTPIRKQGSVWTVLGGLAGLLVEILPVFPIPPAWGPYVPAIGMALGWLTHQLVGPDEYQPKSRKSRK